MVFKKHHKFEKSDFKLSVFKAEIGFLAEVKYILNNLKVQELFFLNDVLFEISFVDKLTECRRHPETKE